MLRKIFLQENDCFIVCKPSQNDGRRTERHVDHAGVTESGIFRRHIQYVHDVRKKSWTDECEW